MSDDERFDESFVSEEQMAAAHDPAVGTGTPETAPHETPFDDDDELDPDGESGDADDEDDDNIDDDEDTPIDEEI